MIVLPMRLRDQAGWLAVAGVEERVEEGEGEEGLKLVAATNQFSRRSLLTLNIKIHLNMLRNIL